VVECSADALVAAEEHWLFERYEPLGSEYSLLDADGIAADVERLFAVGADDVVLHGEHSRVETRQYVLNWCAC
jgi:hypothetical protein